MRYRINKSKKHLGLKKNSHSYLIGSFLITCILTAPVITQAAEDLPVNLTGVSITDADETNQPPIAKFTYTKVGESYTFDASNSSDQDGQIVQYKWKWGGDESTEFGMIKTHTFESTSPYFATLTVVDNAGGISITQKLVYEKNAIVTEQINQNGEGTSIYANFARGQSFKPTYSSYICSIELNLKTEISSEQTLTLRLDSDNDLRLITEGAQSDPIAQSIYNLPKGSIGPIAFDLSSPIFIEEDSQYYFLIKSSNNIYNYRAVISNRDRDSADYSNGSAGIDSNYDGNWDFTPNPAATLDLTFRVISCEQ
ncbi:PKD domain-containing protein [Desulfogranum marinum]|uniref:PKD domain-containing protein n=1 Tax=Desulfogranum marinum TaxID=453220 RepID=UPI0029C8859E|nr:PKD domain-containing protein [Desulfogranum marinum]